MFKLLLLFSARETTWTLQQQSLLQSAISPREFFFIVYSEAPAELWDSVGQHSVLLLHTTNVIYHQGTGQLLLNAC